METTFSDYDSAGGNEPLRKIKGKVTVFLIMILVFRFILVSDQDDCLTPSPQDSPKETSTVTSEQQNAVSAALAAGVPARQQRRLVESSSSSSSSPSPSPSPSSSSSVSPAWRTPPHRGKLWSSASRRMLTTDGSISAR